MEHELSEYITYSSIRELQVACHQEAHHRICNQQNIAVNAKNILFKLFVGIKAHHKTEFRVAESCRQ